MLGAVNPDGFEFVIVIIVTDVAVVCVRACVRARLGVCVRACLSFLCVVYCMFCVSVSLYVCLYTCVSVSNLIVSNDAGKEERWYVMTHVNKGGFIQSRTARFLTRWDQRLVVLRTPA